MLVTAPELVGDTWLGSNGARLSLSVLAGRIVLLDFWTLCCVNCHHVLAELRPIEEEFADVLTVVGVHSPKFDHEKNPDAVASAMMRHGITHPVLNDPAMSTWQAYAVRAWPTLVLIDPQGQIAATYSGEGHGHAIRMKIKELIAQGEATNTLTRGPGVFHSLEPRPEDSPFLQPGKFLILDSQSALVSDSGHHSLAIVDLDDPVTVRTRIGTGQRGTRDGQAESASFNEPYGATRIPPDIASRVGYDIVIADTANHLLRGLNLTDLTVTTIAGTGEQWMQTDATEGPAREVRLSTPWDVTWHLDSIMIAMAGDHRIWQFDPLNATLAVWAGTTHEGLRDADLSHAWFAQPSALVSDSDDLYVIDSETSAVRILTKNEVKTLVGTGLFDFGHVDGRLEKARLQHPLGACLLPGGSIAIADTYNGAIREINTERGTVTTLARGLAEPSDLQLSPDGASLLVLESASGTLTTVPLAGEREREVVAGESRTTKRPPVLLASGVINLTVIFTPPPGQKRDDRYGPSTQLTVSSSPDAMITSGEGTGSELTRHLEIAADQSGGVLHISAKGASCDITTPGSQSHAACHIHQQDWGVPVLIDPKGATELTLTLAG